MRAVLLFVIALAIPGMTQANASVRLKDIARIQGVRDNALTGYGLVIGLSGSGDSSKNRVTVQSVANTLSHYGINVSADDLSTRNVAAVMVTSTLPPFAESGQKLDVEVSSLGDARSLSGGMLLLTPLEGPDGKLYALAQGPVAVGGYRVESFGSRSEKNQTTVGRVPSGATVEQAAPLGLAGDQRTLDVVLYQPDFTTAERVAEAISRNVPGANAIAQDAGKVSIHFQQPVGNVVRAIAQVESVDVTPDQVARVVVNERTGSVVAGGDVRIGAVSITQGDLRVDVQTSYLVSQPEGFYNRPSASIGTAVVPESHIAVHEAPARSVSMPDGTTVTDLVGALRAIHLSTQDVISILQSIKAAGALRGELVIQ